jgi:predicted metal-dependent hydrolase
MALKLLGYKTLSLMKIDTFEYTNYTLHVEYKPSLKNTYISIKSSRDVWVKTPIKSQKYLFTLLEKKRKWIEKQREKISQRKSLHVSLKKEALVFGKLYSIEEKPLESLCHKLQKLPQSTSQEKIIATYNNFYHSLAKEYITQRVEYFSKLMSLEYQEIKFRKMKRRWGSCSSQQVLTFNTQLMKVEKELIDYVVVHELAHLVYMNHSKAFHKLVAQYLSRAEECRKKLQQVSLSF